MLEVDIVLQWDCCSCASPIRTSLRCEGAGLADEDAKAMVKVPCPWCHKNNQVIFTPEDGDLYEVFPEEELVRWKIPVPSYN